MKISVLAISPMLLMCSAFSIASEIQKISGRNCNVHKERFYSLTMDDLPESVRGKPYDAFVVVSYKLDGSGKAIDPKVELSAPKNLFESVAINRVLRTEFSPDVIESHCSEVQIFYSPNGGLPVSPLTGNP